MSNTAECEVCGAEEQSENIESTANYECVCEPCRSNMWECNDCNEEFTADNDKYDVPCGDVCHDCRHGGDYSDCDSCGDIIDMRNGDYYNDSEYSGEIVCHNCSDSTCASCRICGDDIHFHEIGSDHYHAEKCENCYYKNDTHISEFTRGATLNLENLQLKDSYRQMTTTEFRAVEAFYGSSMENYDYNPYLIKKDCLGPRIDSADDAKAWWNGQIKLSSPVYKRVAQMFYELMQLDTFLTEHKRYGIYHPLRHLFRKHIKYYNRKEGGTIKGDEISMQELGQNYWNYSLEFVNTDEITTMLRENNTDDNADLKRAINQIFSRAYKLKFPQYAEFKGGTWAEYFQQYQTNVINTMVNVQIGFDMPTLMENFKRGDQIRSCQTPTNKESYAFGAIDMAVNPHLLAILRDKDGLLIGRSVIRLFKEQWDDEHPMIIAPSRIYLAQHSNVKKEVYVGLFQALNTWAGESFAEGHQLIAYRHSRHDSSIISFIRDSNKLAMDVCNTRPSLNTLEWLPFWSSKPDQSDADFTYYKDEDQRCRLSNVNRGSEVTHIEYAAHEILNGDEYYYIEVKNNNEQ
jgi:hypothetical protein